MACESVQSWSLSGLVAAFLDLAIAYLLLCASAVAYLASHFLGFFGFSLPCPCDGMFLNVNTKIFCLNRLLLDFPSGKASDVQLSVKHRFPFGDPHWHGPCIEGGDNCSDGFLEMEGEGLCTSVSVRKEKYDVKGKGAASHRPRSRLRQRKGGGRGGVHYGHSSNEGGNRFTEGSSLPVENAEAQFLEYNTKDPPTMGVKQISITEINQSPDENMHKKIHIEELQDNSLGFQSLNGDEKNAVRLLEQKLEEERIVRASLYIELEKERSAANSAADEAMAMILRLQEEKAFIEMEARQYQRILEEKSAYDTEEMNILKEILMKREKESLFLEKEVEACRQVISLGDDGPNKCQNERCSLDPQEKEIISADVMSQLASKGREEYKKPIPVAAEGLEQIQNKNQSHKLAENIIGTCNGTETGDTYHGQMLDKDPLVHDVHIIRRPESEVDVKRSSLERTCGGLPPIMPRGLTEHRTNLLSGVESEMLKIDYEVGRLRERLKLVQDGRDKLSLCSESRERGSIQLKLLEDITREVQEIRQLSKPGKTSQQVSLPLPTSKVLSKKRRSRSVSSGIKRSSEGMISN